MCCRCRCYVQTSLWALLVSPLHRGICLKLIKMYTWFKIFAKSFRMRCIESTKTITMIEPTTGPENWAEMVYNFTQKVDDLTRSLHNKL